MYKFPNMYSLEGTNGGTGRFKAIQWTSRSKGNYPNWPWNQYL